MPRGAGWCGFCCSPSGWARAEGPAQRVWKSRIGTTITASVVRIDGEVVVLKRLDGVELSVPIAQLRDADQAFLRTPPPDRGNPFLPLAGADPAVSLIQIESIKEAK
jgi:hypothetical protein